jgi:hypothetical protein
VTCKNDPADRGIAVLFVSVSLPVPILTLLAPAGLLPYYMTRAAFSHHYRNARGIRSDILIVAGTLIFVLAIFGAAIRALASQQAADAKGVINLAP